MSGRHIDAAGYVAGDLPPSALEAAEAHLLTCAACRAAVLQVQAVRTQAGGPGRIVLGFAARMVQGGAMLIGPSLAGLARERPVQEPDAPPEKLPLEPLRVLTPRVAEGTRRMVGLIGRFGGVLVLTFLVLLLPTPAGLSEEGHRALALFVFTGSMLAFEPVSLPIAALMVPVAQVALGIADAPTAFSTYSRPVVFLILASLFLAEALRKHGLTRRLALTTIVASGGGVPQLLLGMMAIAALLSMWVENTATAAVLIPVALTISRHVSDREQARSLLLLLVLGIAYSASVGGMATIMGAASNAVASGFLAQLGPWSFLDWMKYGLPTFLLIFPLTWWLLSRMIPIKLTRLDIEPAREEVQKLGPMSRAEHEILLTMLVAAFFWVTGASIEPALKLPPTLLSAAVVAVMTVAYLAVRNIITWEDVKGVSWGIFLTIGAGLSLGEALTRTGATEWFADLIIPLLGGLPFLAILMSLVFISAILTNVMNNTTIAAVFVPILISLAQTEPNLDAVQLVLPVTLATTFGYSLPSASGRMALIAASGLVERSQMLRYGLIVTLVSSLVLGLFFYLLSIAGLI